MSDDTPREDSFKVTLTSNLCLNYFPNNRANHYTNHLMRKLQCTPPGDWEFALIDMQFPLNWPNVLETTQLAIIAVLQDSGKPKEGARVIMPKPSWWYKKSQFADPKNKSSTKLADPFVGSILEAVQLANESNPGPYDGIYHFTEILQLPKGHYASIEELGRLIEAQYQVLFQAYNKAFAISSSIQFVYDSVTGVARFLSHGPVDIYLACTNKYLLETIFRLKKTGSTVVEVAEPQAATVVPEAGASSSASKSVAPQAKESSTLKYENLHFFKLPLTGQPDAELEHLSSMFVYSDIAQYHLIGGTVGQILGIIPIRSAEGENRARGEQQFYTVNPPYYMPVPKAEIEEITIQLNTDWGAPFPFGEAGSSKVRCSLHFRKRIAQGRRLLLPL